MTSFYIVPKHRPKKTILEKTFETLLGKRPGKRHTVRKKVFLSHGQNFIYCFISIEWSNYLYLFCPIQPRKQKKRHMPDWDLTIQG